MTADLLAGYRVLDLTRVMSGPYCTAMLADIGADVIKVEQPGSGDLSRSFGPYVDGESAYFVMLNRGKRSVSINLKHPEGRGLVLDLAAKSDVVVENFRPGVADRLGLGYDDLRMVQPDIVYCSLYGFGGDTAEADLPALDLVIQAMSGLMSVTGHRETGPTAVGESIADVATGMFASWGILAALLDRERTGRGRHLEVAMMDSVFSMLLTPLSRELYTDTPPRLVGNRHPETYPVDSFATADGQIVIVAPSNAVVVALGTVIGVPDLAEDKRFSDNAARNDHEHELYELIAAWTEKTPTSVALEALQAAGIPSGPVQSLSDVVASSYNRRRGLIGQGTHPTLGPVPLVEQPVRFGDRERGSVAVPTLGEHTDEVLREILELDDTALERLRDAYAIGGDDRDD